MASAYPGGIDSFSTSRVDATAMATTHPADHNNYADAINKIETELGTNLSRAVTNNRTQAGTTGAPTPTTIWTFQPVDTNKGPFTLRIGGASFSSTWDTVMYHGYNVSTGGGRVLTSEPTFYWAVEQDYNDGVKHVIENYWQYTNAAGSFTARPIMIQVNRATDANPQFEFRGNQFTFSDWTTGTPFATWDKTGVAYLGQTGGGTTVWLKTAASQASVVQMQYNAVNTFGISAEIAAGTAFIHGSTYLAWWFSAGSGRVSFFGQDNTTARMTIIGDTSTISFASKADASQGESLIAALNSSGAKLSHFNKGGYFMTRKTSAPADGDLASSEMALWFDATNGASKLMVKAKQADGTVKTASVALA